MKIKFKKLIFDEMKLKLELENSQLKKRWEERFIQIISKLSNLLK